MRNNYEMSEEDLKTLINACKPVPYIIVGRVRPVSPQENANRAWASLGRKMGFDPMSVKPIPGKGPKYFTAIPTEGAIHE